MTAALIGRLRGLLAVNDPGTKAAWFFALIGIGLLISAGFRFYRDNQLALRGRTASATVVDFRTGKDNRNSTVRQRDADPNNAYEFRAPVIRFTTQNGDVIQLSAPLGSFPDDLKRGDTLAVVYLAEDPRSAEIKGSPRFSGGMLAFLIIGGACILPALFMVAIPALRGRNNKVRRWIGAGNNEPLTTFLRSGLRHFAIHV